MAQLHQLPTEVLFLIISELRSNRDFLALSLTCRSIHNLTIKELPLRRKYRRIRIKSQKDIDKAFVILLSILRRPQLGGYVRHIEYDQPPKSYHNYEIRTKDLKVLSNEDSRILQMAVTKASFTGEYAEKVINMILQSPPPYHFGDLKEELRTVWIAQALAALLVSASPYLESMATSVPMYVYGFSTETGASLGMPQEIMRFPLEKLLIEANSEQPEKPYLQYLHSVEIIPHEGSGWDDERFYMRFELLSMLLLFTRLPSMEYICVDAVMEEEDGPFDLEPSSSNLSRIRIEHSNLRTWFLMPIIYSCKVLREFHYTIGGRASLDGSFAPFNPRTFLKSILGHKTTLEILHIDADSNLLNSFFLDMDGYDNGLIDHDEDESEPDLVPPQGFWERTGSLRDFLALTELHIGIGILMYLALGTESMDVKDPDLVKPFGEVVLAESLPPALESFTIIGYEKGVRKDFDKIIEQFMADRDGKLPHLKDVNGIEEAIERADTVRYPDESELLWEPEEDEWSEHEYLTI
ncbi:conserved hypothetical protein [Talaromyces stipitatus ATCC 10500]|uniref:F-box domain-containing protein n=1 Tax=Talaromyces stipitatus (strain ATCC 10500 / CBS 375.48 / QM 6759 / NRRL 1006) TaxID=441959 RepID=B8MKY5_TALSN|nr:uncharacterized protein TSTA_048420 [Talaromyces stipitatus ATCC 10500]EED15401.1 conserved hypothetical protein [Talaromyces stipitatus ATCC 10500]